MAGEDNADETERLSELRAPFVTALLRIPDVVAGSINVDVELSASGVTLPSDPSLGGWGFHPLVPCAADPVSNLFRIRLACMLLETSGMFFCKGVLKARLDTFLTYFQVGHLVEHARSLARRS